MATCRDILYNASTKDLKFIAGEQGLDRVITWCYSIFVRPVSHWTTGGELAFYYGAGGNGMDNSDEGLAELVKECYEANLSGLVLIVGDTYVTKIPQSVIDTANQLNFPVFSTDSRAFVSKLQQNIVMHVANEEKQKTKKQEFWSTLFLDDPQKNGTEFFTKAHYFGVDPTGSYCVYILRFQNLSEYVESARELDRMDHAFFVNDFLDSIHKKAEYFILSKTTPVLTFPRNEDLVIVCSVTPKNTTEKMARILSSTCETLEAFYPGAKFVIGKGQTLDGVIYLKESYIQARRALSLPNRNDTYVYDYDSIGFYKILFAVNGKTSLADYIQDTIYTLESYDQDNGTNLLETLEVYINCRGNVSQTATTLYSHRNTINQRLDRIATVLSKDLNNAAVFYDLQIGLQIYHFLKETNLEESYL